VPLSPATDSVTLDLIGLAPFVLILAAALALPVSAGLLRLYRRAVLASMRARTNPRTTEPPPPNAPPPPDAPRRARLDLAVLDHASPAGVGTAAEALYSGVLRAPLRVAAIYGVAGSCYALVMVAAFVGAANIESRPTRLLPLFVLLFCSYAWPVVLMVNLVAVPIRLAQVGTVSVYLLVLAATSAVIMVVSPEFGWGDALLIWLFINLPATVLLLACLNRRIRAVGPLVFAFVCLALVGHLALVVAVVDDGQFRAVSGLAAFLGLGVNGVLLGLIILGLAVFGLAGWLALRWIGGRYERKRISDQSFTVDAVWMLCAIVHSTSLLALGSAAWALSGLLALAAYKAVSWAGFSLLSRRAAPALESPKLLLLRVFSLGKRSERLFDKLATHWRYAGSVQFIAGPDLVTTTVEPHEFLDFLSGKLARRFIDGPKTLELRISEADLEPDPDGRFRVNDFFCHDDTWRMVLSRLVGESDAVLMDLRGFSPQNAGCVFEINELINVVPLGRVVFVIDDTTDEPFLHQTARQSWERMRPASPNRLSASGQLRLFRFAGSRRGELSQLLRCVCVAAKAAPSVVPEATKAEPPTF
jgi:hypothetical protein